MTHTPMPTRKRPAWLRGVTIGCVAITAWHLLATFLWVAPPSGLRDLVPQKALSSYMMPLFGQSWSVFAPSPVNGDYTVKVRAQLEGSKKATEWVDATDVESRMLTHHLSPQRAAILGGIQGRDYKKTFDKLEKAQKDVVAAGYFKGDDWLARLDQSLIASAESTAEKHRAEAHMEAEKTTTAYATQVAHAVWGDAVNYVEFEVSRQSVVPFKHRHDPEAKRPEAVVISTGWRGRYTVPGQNQERFAEVFNRARGER